MKSTIIAAVAVAAVGASAQDVTVTEYYDDCTTSTMPAGGMATVTGTITDTYCGECELGKTGTTTVYTTVYQELCPTGTQLATYTITEALPAGQVPGPTHVPSGFTVTTVTCPVCPGSPMVTLTTPAAAAASPTGAPAPPVISTAAAIGVSPPAMASMGGAAPAMASPMSAAVPGMASMGAAAPVAPAAPAPAAASNAMPAAASSIPAQKIAGAASPSTAVGSSNGTVSPTMFTGAATSSSVGITLCAGVAGLVGVIAMAL
ncbi:MAG: hypothetical protein LQ347_003680 [Umbilicaria vellea]|nr:MAG: hypothetical protein LQ347_003680 [Umbilicaria vellea]